MKNIKNIIIFLVIGTAFVLIYVYFIKKSPANTEPLVSSGVGLVPVVNDAMTAQENSAVAKDFLDLLLSVKSIKLDDSIFSDDAFISLHDSSIVLVPDGSEGRPNPFAPIGVDVAVIFPPLTQSNASPATSNDLWAIYDKVVLALKNKDVASFNMYSHSSKQVASTEVAQFSQTAPLLYAQSIKNKTDYINKWQDAKQAIFSTDPKKDDDTSVYGYSKRVVMFVNENDSWKMLLDSPKISWYVSKAGTNQSAAQIERDLQAMMLDSDEDGLTDQEETCTGGEQYNTSCVKSNPNKKDTDADGWWDGIEINMNK